MAIWCAHQLPLTVWRSRIGTDIVGAVSIKLDGLNATIPEHRSIVKGNIEGCRTIARNIRAEVCFRVDVVISIMSAPWTNNQRIVNTNTYGQAKVISTCKARVVTTGTGNIITEAERSGKKQLFAQLDQSISRQRDGAIGQLCRIKTNLGN